MLIKLSHGRETLCCFSFFASKTFCFGIRDLKIIVNNKKINLLNFKNEQITIWNNYVAFFALRWNEMCNKRVNYILNFFRWQYIFYISSMCIFWSCNWRLKTSYKKNFYFEIFLNLHHIHLLFWHNSLSTKF